MANHFNTVMRAKLIDLRNQLTSAAAGDDDPSQIVELDQSRMGRLSRMDAMQSQAMAQASGRRRAVLLRKVAIALARIDNGSFGVCQSCEQDIPRKRLEFDPTAELCVDCASSAERR